MVAAAALASLPGCVNQQSSTISAGVDLRRLRRLHVVRLPADTRGIERLVAEELRRGGLVVTIGTEADAPPDADALVTYNDRWMWDITMYMISLDIALRDPRTRFPIASGRSVRSSLVRGTPEEMVREVLARIFGTTAA
jgi:hypothetical protein